MAESNGYQDIREGFICPICHKNLQSARRLLVHFEDLHSEEQDVLKSLRGKENKYEEKWLGQKFSILELLGKAKKKILNYDEQEFVSFDPNFIHDSHAWQNEPQEPGCVNSHTDYFKTIRRERLDYKTTETNMLILRLDKLLKIQGSDRKQQEQRVVPWIDGDPVSRCPNCASSFNITKRQHHCRLCGSIMCNACSEFLSNEIARKHLYPKQKLMY